MNSSYLIPLCISLVCHSALMVGGGLFGGTHAHETVCVEQSLSALEICIIGAEYEQVAGAQRTREEIQEKTEIGQMHVMKETVSRVKNEGNSVVSHTRGNSTINQTAAVGAQTDTVEPSPIKNPAPTYPRAARERGEEGMVVLDVVILSDGSVGGIEVYQSSGYRALDRSASEAVSRWKFKPATLNHTPVTLSRRIPIVFKLR